MPDAAARVSRLVIGEASYSLLQTNAAGWTEIAALAKGAAALLDPQRPVDEARLERAIEIAEDWLMPHAARLRGEVLEVEDSTGRLRAGLAEVLGVTATQWGVDDIERIFLRLVDLATGRSAPPGLQQHRRFIADVVLLRELAHHGKVAGLRSR